MAELYVDGGFRVVRGAMHRRVWCEQTLEVFYLAIAQIEKRVSAASFLRESH